MQRLAARWGAAGDPKEVGVENIHVVARMQGSCSDGSMLANYFFDGVGSRVGGRG